MEVYSWAMFDYRRLGIFVYGGFFVWGFVFSRLGIFVVDSWFLALLLREQTAKAPAKEMPSKPLSVVDPAKTTAPKSHGAGSTPKSLGKDTVLKKAAEAPPQQSLPSVKLEVSQCTRCFAQTFQGQIQCDVV